MGNTDKFNTPTEFDKGKQPASPRDGYPKKAAKKAATKKTTKKAAKSGRKR